MWEERRYIEASKSQSYYTLLKSHQRETSHNHMTDKAYVHVSSPAEIT